MRTGFGAAVIGALAARIGADDQQIGARRLARVRNPGRDHDDVAGAQFDGLALSPPSRTRALPAAMPSTSCAVL
jgi:hypothetical protein